jgi:hypothetical protein
VGAATDAYVAITRLQAAYADVVTRRAWPELDALFAPDASIRVDTITRPVIELVGAPALGEFISTAIARFEFFEFVVLNTVVDVNSDSTAGGRVYMVEIRQERESGEWSNAFGVYRDRYVEYDGRWRFSERRYQSLARRIGAGPASVFPMPS